MTAPGHRFGTHDRAALRAAKLQQALHGFGEIAGLNVIRVTAKAGVAPAGVYGIAARMAQAAEFLEVSVGDGLMPQRFGERVAVELRITAGTRDCSNIREPLGAVPAKQRDEFFDGARGVADGKNRQGCARGGLRLFREFQSASHSSCSAEEAVDQDQENDNREHHVEAVLFESERNDGKENARDRRGDEQQQTALDNGAAIAMKSSVRDRSQTAQGLSFGIK